MMRVLVVDGYGSFTHSLCQQIGILGAEPVVVQGDTPPDRIRFVGFDRIVLSPGPGQPGDVALYQAIFTTISRTVPTLGVCLGHQMIGLAFGAQITQAGRPMHGKQSVIRHGGAGLYAGVRNPLIATRYHSLAIDPAMVPDCLEVTARSDDDGAVMGIRHREFPIHGMQFHPESILTPDGNRLMANFLSDTGDRA
jgi:anthranilate synthase component 2